MQRERARPSGLDESSSSGPGPRAHAARSLARHSGSRAERAGVAPLAGCHGFCGWVGVVRPVGATGHPACGKGTWVCVHVSVSCFFLCPLALVRSLSLSLSLSLSISVFLPHCLCCVACCILRVVFGVWYVVCLWCVVC